MGDSQLQQVLGYIFGIVARGLSSKAEPPGHLSGTAPRRDRWHPALHAGDARGQVCGRGREATGARAQSQPINNIAAPSFIRPSGEVPHNMTRIDRTRAALILWRGGGPTHSPRGAVPRAVRRLTSSAAPSAPLFHRARDARPSGSPGRSLQRTGTTGGRNPAKPYRVLGPLGRDALTSPVTIGLCDPWRVIADYPRLPIRVWSAQVPDNF